MSQLDSKIRSLKYDENKLLARKELGVSSYTAAEGRLDGSKYIVVNRTKRTMDSDSYDIGVVESVIDRTFPGSLIMVNNKLADNNPDILVTNRKPMKFRIDIPGMGSDAEFTVDNPNYINVSTGIDNTLKKYTGQSLPTRITFKGSIAYSEAQINAAFGLEMKQVSKQLSIDFKAISEKKSTVYIASFRQIFYTVSSDMPQNPSDVFADSVTWESLQERGLGDSNPPGLVNKVGYGRFIYVKIESNEQSNIVEAALKASINSNMQITTDTKYKNVLKNSNFTAVVLGGNSREHTKVVSCKDIDDVKKIIENNSEYGKNNPGYPVFYNAIFLKNNQNAKTMSTVEYIETTSEIHEGGTIKLKHTGGYVAQFKVTWNEVSYNAKGQKSTVSKSWKKNSKDLTAPFKEEIELKGNCENINVKAWGCTGLAWDWWRTIFEKTNVPMLPSRTFEVYGTTLNQKYSIDPKV